MEVQFLRRCCLSQYVLVSTADALNVVVLRIIQERVDSEKNYLRRALRELQAGSRPPLEGEEVKTEEEVHQFYQLYDVYAEKYGTDMVRV